MPVEIHQLHLRPADFFTCNPAIDVPGVKNISTVLTPDSETGNCCGNGTGDVQQNPSSHLQGGGSDITADGNAAAS